MLNELEAAHAAQHGWQLCEVFDLKTRRLNLAILPTKFEKTNASAAYAAVLVLAGQRDAVALKALALITNFGKRKKK